MSRGILSNRFRLLWIAGVVVPLVMSLVGAILAWSGTGNLPDIARLPDLRELLLGALTAGVSMGVVYVLSKTNKQLERALRDSGVRVGEEALRLAGYPVMLVVVSTAAFGEEMLFRGGLQPLIGLVLAALLFGFSHGGWRKEMLAYAFAATISGALFGLSYWLTGDLWVPIVAHMLHNILATVVLGTDKADAALADPYVMEMEGIADEQPDESVSAESDGTPDGVEAGESADGSAQ